MGHAGTRRGGRRDEAEKRSATTAGVDARYREIRSTKGHDAFLVEWDQLTTLLREALGD